MEKHKGKRPASTQKKFRLYALGIYPFCQWCQCPLTPATATTDHLIPRSRGGSNRWENLCLACVPCNHGRKDDLPRCVPSGPRWETVQFARPEKPPWVAWTRYLGGRWRRTIRGNSPEELLEAVGKLMGNCVETVILREGEEPMGCFPQIDRAVIGGTAEAREASDGFLA